jgi:hypothetical protein
MEDRRKAKVVGPDENKIEKKMKFGFQQDRRKSKPC